MAAVPFSIEPTIEGDTITLRLVGPLDLETVAVYIDEHLAQFTLYSTIWDLRACELRRATPQDLKSYLRRTRPSAEARRGNPSALVSRGEDQHAYHQMLADLAAEMKHPVPIRAFRSLDEARHWIDRAIAKGDPSPKA